MGFGRWYKAQKVGVQVAVVGGDLAIVSRRRLRQRGHRTDEPRHAGLQSDSCADDIIVRVGDANDSSAVKAELCYVVDWSAVGERCDGSHDGGGG